MYFSQLNSLIFLSLGWGMQCFLSSSIGLCCCVKGFGLLVWLLNLFAGFCKKIRVLSFFQHMMAPKSLKEKARGRKHDSTFFLSAYVGTKVSEGRGKEKDEWEATLNPSLRHPLYFSLSIGIWTILSFYLPLKNPGQKLNYCCCKL